MDRRVRSTKKDRSGKIIALCNPGQKWSPRSTQQVARDINAGKKSYYVQEQERRTYLRSVAGGVAAGPDATGAEKLSQLPTC